MEYNHASFVTYVIEWQTFLFTSFIYLHFLHSIHFTLLVHIQGQKFFWQHDFDGRWRDTKIDVNNAIKDFITLWNCLEDSCNRILHKDLITSHLDMQYGVLLANIFISATIRFDLPRILHGCITEVLVGPGLPVFNLTLSRAVFCYHATRASADVLFLELLEAFRAWVKTIYWKNRFRNLQDASVFAPSQDPFMC